MLKNILSRIKKNTNGKPKRNLVIAPCRYQIDAEECRSCGKCKRACKAGAISGGRRKAYVIDELTCTKCGNCMKRCKYKAIKQLDMCYIKQKADNMNTLITSPLAPLLTRSMPTPRPSTRRSYNTRPETS